MKKYFSVLLLLFIGFSNAQMMSYDEVINSDNPEIIEKFIRENPKHRQIGKLRYTLIKANRVQKEINKKKRAKERAISIKEYRAKIAERRANREEYDARNNRWSGDEWEATPEISSSSETSAPETSIASNTLAASQKRIAPQQRSHGESLEMLNHLFDNSKNKKKAYLQIQNRSKCPIRISIKGKRNYVLDIHAMSDGDILVMKGTYVLSGKICGKDYRQNKKLTKDIALKLKD